MAELKGILSKLSGSAGYHNHHCRIKKRKLYHRLLHRIIELLKSDRAGIRTQDPQLRRLLLYPAELPDHPYFGGAKVGIFLLKANFRMSFFLFLPETGLEGVSYGKMECEILLEIGIFDCPTTCAMHLRIVSLKARVETKQEEIEVHAQS